MKAKLVVEGKEFPIEINDPELQKLISQPKKTGYELVKDGHTYSFVNSYGGVMTLDHKDDDDDNRYSDANYYSDRTVAENNARADKLMRQLRRFAVAHREKDIDWAEQGVKCAIRFSHGSNELYINHECFGHDFGMIAFDSEKAAQLAIDLFHDELIWYFTEYKDSL